MKEIFKKFCIHAFWLILFSYIQVSSFLNAIQTTPEYNEAVRCFMSSFGDGREYMGVFFFIMCCQGAAFGCAGLILIFLKDLVYPALVEWYKFFLSKTATSSISDHKVGPGQP